MYKREYMNYHRIPQLPPPSRISPLHLLSTSIAYSFVSRISPHPSQIIMWNKLNSVHCHKDFDFACGCGFISK